MADVSIQDQTPGFTDPWLYDGWILQEAHTVEITDSTGFADEAI